MIANRKQYTSKGCLMCIQRRVKCDQKRPSCDRCIKGRVKRQCPGYRAVQEIGFRHTFVIGPPSFSPSMNEVAVPHFIASIASRSKEPTQLEPLVALVASLSAECSPVFMDALLATSCAYFVQRTRPFNSALRHEALQHYSRSLSSLRTALSSPNFESEKEAILIAMTLHLYRDQIIGENWSFESPHAKAAFNIMLNSGNPNYGLSSRFDDARWMILIAGAIGHLLKPGTFPHPWRDASEYERPGREGDFKSFILRASFVCTAFERASAEAEDSGSSDELIGVARRVLATDALSRTISERLDREQMFGVKRYEDRNTVPGFRLRRAYFFRRMDVARVWTVLWSCRVRLLDALNTFLSKGAGKDLEHEILERLRDKTQITDDLCAVVPYMLHELDDEGAQRTLSEPYLHGPGSWLCADALFVVGSSHGIPHAQKDWIMNRLNYIGHERGIGEALQFRAVLNSTTTTPAFAKPYEDNLAAGQRLVPAVEKHGDNRDSMREQQQPFLTTG